MSDDGGGGGNVSGGDDGRWEEGDVRALCGCGSGASEHRREREQRSVRRETKQRLRG